MSEAATWVVKTDVKRPWVVSRHRANEHGRPSCSSVGYHGAFRVLAEGEVDRYHPCGKCLPAEHDGPYDAANAAAAQVREAASAVARCSIGLDDLGYHRMALSLKGTAENLFESADYAEVQG